MLEYAFTSYKHTQNFHFNFEERDVDVSYLVPSKYHWKLVNIQVRHVPVPALQRQIIVCNSSLEPCCPKASETPDTIEKFYQSHLKNGEWINGGHCLKEPENSSIKTCKQRQSSIQNRLDACDNQEGPHDPVPTANDANEEPTASIAYKTFAKEESTASIAYKKFTKGIDLLQDCNGGLGRRIDFNEEVSLLRSRLSGRSDLDEAANGLSILQQQSKGLAESISWKWEHLIRCIRILQRSRGCMTTADDPDGIACRQERSAYRINEFVDRLFRCIGAPALVVFSAFSVMNFVWDGIGRVETPERIKRVLDKVCQEVLDTGFEFPTSILLFNPASTLSWLLGESHLCGELGLGNLSSIDPNGDVGVFREAPLGPIMGRVDDLNSLGLRLRDDTKAWVLAGRKTDSAVVSSAVRKRKRITATTHLEMREGSIPISSTSPHGETSAHSQSPSNAFPEIAMGNYDSTEQSMAQTGSLHVLPDQMGNLTATPGSGDVGNTLWPNVGPICHGADPIHDDPFMGSIVSMNELFSLGPSSVTTFHP